MADQHGLVTFGQARELGLLDRHVAALVRRARWLRVRRGIFVDADAWAALDPYRGQPLLRVRAAHLVVQHPHWFSHESSALVHDLPLADPQTARVHLTRPRVLGDRAKAGIVHHKAVFRPQQAIVVEGLPVLDLARTACDLARGSGLTAGLAACDAAERRGVTKAQLRAVREQMRCWRGCQHGRGGHRPGRSRSGELRRVRAARARALARDRLAVDTVRAPSRGPDRVLRRARGSARVRARRQGQAHPGGRGRRGRARPRRRPVGGEEATGLHHRVQARRLARHLPRPGSGSTHRPWRGCGGSTPTRSPGSAPTSATWRRTSSAARL